MLEDRSAGGTAPRMAERAQPAEAPQGACKACPLRDLCSREEAPQANGARADGLGRRQRRIRRREFVYRVGEPLTALHIVRRGSFLSKVRGPQGGMVTADLAFPGAILGFDCAETRRHTGSATALEDGDVCDLPVDPVGVREPALEREVMTRLRVARDEGARHAVERLRKFRSEQLVAAVLVELALQGGARGGSVWRMSGRVTAEDLARQLGLKVEVVERACAGLERMNLMRLAGGVLEIPDLRELERFADA